jgi:hypothetical protein
MTELWTFAAFDTDDVSQRYDLTGWDVEAEDGHMGKVDEATYDVGRSYVVVDTGFWIFGKKRMVPAGTIRRIDPDSQSVFIGLTKDEIKQAPDYEEEQRLRDEPYMQRHSDYYGRSWESTSRER